MSAHAAHDSGGGTDYTNLLLILLLIATFIYFVSKLTVQPNKNVVGETSVKHVIPTATTPRSEVLFYTTQYGDTIEAIGKAFKISQETIRRVNEIPDDEEVESGVKLTILPVSGYMHKVVEAETVYTIASKYKVDPMSIVNYPFNSFKNPNTFELEVDQTLIVPE